MQAPGWRTTRCTLWPPSAEVLEAKSSLVIFTKSSMLPYSFNFCMFGDVQCESGVRLGDMRILARMEVPIKPGSRRACLRNAQ